jgi:hypothetical protein
MNWNEYSRRKRACVIKNPWKGRLRLNQGGREAREEKKKKKNITWWRILIVKSFLMRFLQSLVASSHLPLNILLSTLFSNTPSLFPSIKDSCFRNHITFSHVSWLAFDSKTTALINVVVSTRLSQTSSSWMATNRFVNSRLTYKFGTCNRSMKNKPFLLGHVTPLYHPSD